MAVSKDTSNKTTSSFPASVDDLRTLHSADMVDAGYFNRLLSGAAELGVSIGADVFSSSRVTWKTTSTNLHDFGCSFRRVYNIRINLADVYASPLYNVSQIEVDFPAGMFTKTGILGSANDVNLVVDWGTYFVSHDGVAIDAGNVPGGGTLAYYQEQFGDSTTGYLVDGISFYIQTYSVYGAHESSPDGDSYVFVTITEDPY
jgi:hypothetical protein